MPGNLPLFQRRWFMLLAIALPLALLVGISMLNGRAVAQLEEMSARVSELRDAEKASGRLLRCLVDNETGQRGYLLAQKPVFLEPYERSLNEMPRLQASLDQLLADSRGKELLETLHGAIKERLAFASKTVEMERAGDEAGSVALVRTGEGKRLMDQVRQSFAQLDLFLVKTIQEAQQQYAAMVQWNQKVAWAMVAVQCAFLAMVFALLVRLRTAEHFVHVCAWSRTIEYEGEWITFEDYLSRKFDYKISHGISPEEALKLRTWKKEAA